MFRQPITLYKAIWFLPCPCNIFSILLSLSSKVSSLFSTIYPNCPKSKTSFGPEQFVLITGNPKIFRKRKQRLFFSIGYSRNRSVILFTILSRKFRYITCTDLNTDLNDIAVRMYPTNETANLNSINYLLNGIQKQTLHDSAHHIYSWEIAVYDSVKKTGRK